MVTRKEKEAAIRKVARAAEVYDAVLETLNRSGHLVVTVTRDDEGVASLPEDEDGKELLEIIGLDRVLDWVTKQELADPAAFILQLEPSQDTIKTVCREMDLPTLEDLEFDPGHPVIRAAITIALSDNAFESGRAIGDLRRELYNAGIQTIAGASLLARNV